MTTYRVGDRVAIAPHLDLWMAGCRYATITSINEGTTGGRFYFADLDTGRNVTLVDEDLAGVVSDVRKPEVRPLKEWLGLMDRTDANAGLPQQDHLLRTAAALLTDGDLPHYDAALVDLLKDLGLFAYTEDKQAMLETLRRHMPDRRPEHVILVAVQVKAGDREQGDDRGR